ncbi:hypothetical protein NPIL_161681 [Nephila pilipes]|uniref:Uncharacterized protein n=1 Tax=Nephila pilipes TaxID=299642 RepID=A0A8X6IFS8_NEPPI|nr:hypothetical protein NPIL_161681 [Nephila pilipes]
MRRSPCCESADCGNTEANSTYNWYILAQMPGQLVLALSISSSKAWDSFLRSSLLVDVLRVVKSTTGIVPSPMNIHNLSFSDYHELCSLRMLVGRL